MRVFVPSTLAALRDFVASGTLSMASSTAFALTPRLRESYAAGDSEELEYAAMMEAARGSLRLLATGFGGGSDGGAELPPRRVVVAADVEGPELAPHLDDAAVTLAEPITMLQVRAVHVDGAEAEKAVRAAAEVIDAADLGDPDAEFVLGDAEDHDMAWYDPTELPFLFELL